MHIEYFAEFVDLAKTLSFSETARRLYITQPTLTRHVAQLEKDLGIALLKRTTRSVELTAAGELLRQRIEPVVVAYDAAIDSVLESVRGSGKKLRIAFPYQFIDRYLQSELDTFMKNHPDARIELIPIAPQNGERMLLDGACDVSFDILFPYVEPNSHFVGRVLGLERFCICMPKQNRLARKAKIHPSDLSGCTFIKAADYPQYNAFVDAFIEKSNIKAPRFVFADAIELVYQAALEHNALEIRIATSGVPEREGIAYVPLDSDLTAKIRLVRLATCENPLARQLV